ncbi:uncharacterized protein LOC115626018 [Scaptodrosophila lebanonensis]|uniref:Uncharacterized protein LOC115626018 n=1 Tax=Drosophila lebanonensis TaxID=7225 RepID=A0A6J2TKG6_DROLE|nr:uncharacterized protein LOC115626018 [Scaptodrosophila lebanonensis]
MIELMSDVIFLAIYRCLPKRKLFMAWGFTKWKAILLLIVLCACLQLAEGIWFPWYFHRYGLEPHSQRHKGGSAEGSGGGSTCPPGYKPKNGSSTVRLCDDNPVLLQLARLYIISPERIMLLLAQPSLIDSCSEISDVLSHIRANTANCRLAEDNIYGKLTDGLDYFKAEVCDGGDSSTRKRCAELSDSHNCIRELRTDMIECEAPADWYEKRNATKVCQIFNDVLDCYYTRAAMLCGLSAARQLRSLSADCMKRGIIHPCTVSNRLPRVDDPMPACGPTRMSTFQTVTLGLICYCILW